MTSSICGIGHATRHPLPDVRTISLCAVICGEHIWMGVEERAEIRQDVLTGWLAHDTFGHVFTRLYPAQFEAGFLRWTQEPRAITVTCHSYDEHGTHPAAVARAGLRM